MKDSTAANPLPKPGAPALLDDDDPALFPKLTDPQLELIAPHGEVRPMQVGEVLETSRPGVFAAGDVRSGSTKMVAPAVGEGGMAVRFVAEHLARPQLAGRS